MMIIIFFRQAADARLELTGCALLHAGDLWFGPRRPGAPGGGWGDELFDNCEATVFVVS